jgi:hypothetical protein
MSEEQITEWLQGILSSSAPPLPCASPNAYGNILQKAEWHGVTSLIYYILNANNKWTNYPDKLRQQFSEKTRQNVVITMLWKQEFLDVHSRLLEAKIPVLLIKGLALSYNLYPAPYLRPFGDVDVLCLDRETAEKAYKIIGETGYKRPNEISGKYIYHLLSCSKHSNTGFNFTLGLHWRVNNLNYFANAFSYGELEATSQSVTELSPAVRTFSYENALLLACLHRVAHTPDGKANRLIWLYDIHLLANVLREHQWSTFVDMSIRKNLAGVSVDGLLKSKESLNTCIPDRVIEDLNRHATTDPFHAMQDASRWIFYLRSFQSMPSWNARLCLIKEHLFPSPKYIMDKYHNENILLLPFLYIKRIFQGLIKLI